jgi:diguanylate cyclase (GGDEF)-like protein
MVFFIATTFILLVSNIFLLFGMRRLAAKTMHDDISNLPNYSYVKLYLNKNLSKKNIAIAILDINNFKTFNSISIHCGDNVLYEFAEEIKKLMYGTAIICRYRLGDEFVLIFNDTEREEIIANINIVQQYFSNYAFSCLPEMQDYRLGFCYGISEIKPETENQDSFLAVAELELAKAKREIKT